MKTEDFRSDGHQCNPCQDKEIREISIFLGAGSYGGGYD